MTSASVAAVYEFLRDRNAPFNVQLLVDNLQTKKVKKSQVEKALATLVTEGKVTRKEFGKTKIYFLAQANLEKATTEELTSLKGRAAELKNDVSSERQMLSSMQKELAKLKTELTSAEIKKEVQTCKKHVADAKAKLELLDSKSGSVSKESFTETRLLLQQNLVLWRKYKKMFNEIWGSMAESMGDEFDKKKEKKLQTDIGIEADESAGVVYSSLDSIVNRSEVPKKRRLNPL